jgi:hypothetical protein
MSRRKKKTQTPKASASSNSPPQQGVLFEREFLIEQQRIVLRAMQEGKSLEESAASAKTEAKTIRSWFKDDPSFAKAWEEAQREDEQALRATSRSLARQSLNTLREVMQTDIDDYTDLDDSEGKEADTKLTLFVLSAKAKVVKEILGAKVKAAQTVLSLVPKSVWGDDTTSTQKGTTAPRQEAGSTPHQEAQSQSQSQTPPPPQTPAHDPILESWRSLRGKGDC